MVPGVHTEAHASPDWMPSLSIPVLREAVTVMWRRSVVSRVVEEARV